MSIRIGIPRSLFYFRFMPLWEAFFQELGIEVIVSEPTNRRILDDGVKSCVDEACLPVKLFHGHVLNLAGKVDYLFIPRFTSISRNEYICPEFGGLPDMVRHTLKNLPPIVDTEINLRKSDAGAVRAAVETAAFLGRSGRSARRALRAALENYWDFCYQAQCGVLPFERAEAGTAAGAGRREAGCAEAAEPEQGGRAPARPARRSPLEAACPGNGVPRDSAPSIRPAPPPLAAALRIAVIGHPYNVYDRYISMDLLGKLQKLGARIRTVEMVDRRHIQEHSSKLSKPMFWNYGRKAYGAAVHLAAGGEIDGMICVTSFGCGIDSFVHDLIERKVRKEYGIPFIIMTVDEHSGEAGFNTRLEAFIDMLRWRRSNENDIPASG